MRLKVWAVIIAVMVGWGFWQNYNAKQERLAKHLRVVELYQAYVAHVEALDFSTWSKPVRGDMNVLAQRDKALQDFCTYAHQYYQSMEELNGAPYSSSSPTYIDNKAGEHFCQSAAAMDSYLTEVPWNQDGTMNISKKDTVEYYTLLNAYIDSLKQLEDADAVVNKAYAKQLNGWAQEDK